MIEGVIVGPGAAAHRDLRRAVPLLLPGGFGGGADRHPHLRLPHAGRRLPLAEKCGVAFQLTNILRDVREDAGRDRVYLPAEDLARFHVDAGGTSATASEPTSSWT